MGKLRKVTSRLAAPTVCIVLTLALLSFTAKAQNEEKIPFPEVFKLFLESAPTLSAAPIPVAEACQPSVGKDFLSALPADVGLSAAALLKLNEALDAGSHDIRGLLIVRDCRLVFERYGEDIGREHNHTIYSVTKSVTATVVGALLMQGKLRSIDVAIADVMSKPFWMRESNWKKAERITLKNVMQMSSGISYKHDPVNNPIYALSADRFSLALQPDLIAEPGTRFNYSDGDVSLTGAMVAAAADMNLYRVARQVLFEKLQMHNYAWAFMDGAGRYPGGWGLRLRPMDMAKIGQLYLQNGEWNGMRIFSPQFRELAWTPGVNKNYGLHWWIRGTEGTNEIPHYEAQGFKGQRIYVFPTLRMTAVLTASLPGAEERLVVRLIIDTLKVAQNQGTKPSESEASATLVALQKKGFRGQTRVFQQDQDNPSRF